MSENDNSFYITTPIYYVNGDPHIGHAYTSVACDVFARFKRMDGYRVHFLTGTDEHGLKVYQAAREEGRDPQDFCDQVSSKFKDILPQMNITNDDFIRTTEERHKHGAQAFWQKLKDNDDIYLDRYRGWYAVRDEAYYSEDELEVTDDGRRIAPSGAECEWTEEESYFFRLSAWQDKLVELYENHPEFIQPESRRNEVMSFVKSGLRDLSISRTTFSWGVPVPDDPDHVMYVWIDALANYITALGYPDTDCDLYQSFWPANIHMIGKEITRFHAVYWPAFLMSAGVELPRQIYANGWLVIEGQKMSKSLGNVITPDDLVNTYTCDGARYHLMQDVVLGNDGDFSHQPAINRINSDLANGFGNLAQRTLSMIYKNCEAAIPAPDSYTEDDIALLKQTYSAINDVRREMDAVAPDKAIKLIWRVVDAANSYIDAQAPWVLKKEDTTRMKTVLYVLAETLRCLGIMTWPVTPATASHLLDQLKVDERYRCFAALDEAFALQDGIAIDKPQPIFPRLVDESATDSQQTA
jgi:methionyl-tRNA synthetase